ncbi:HTH-type transcriptional regulator PuuR [Cardiobacteriaceae bacterium TAE3-ERU3]|nr:HTH-type transcriptional regulator PuuR [Cardiobacteriaceae bacterium TAE3-ERU3]
MSEPSNIIIGNKISELRLAKGFSQRRLAQLAGLTNTAISSIEHGKVSPSINTLAAILNELDTDLADFFTNLHPPKKTQVVVKPHELVNIGDEQVAFRLVHNHQPNRRLGFMLEEYQPHTQTEEQISHEGEEAGTVISGKITIRLGTDTYHLEAGDSYVIDTSIPHTFINDHDGICRIISAHTPTTY